MAGRSAMKQKDWNSSQQKVRYFTHLISFTVLYEVIGQSIRHCDLHFTKSLSYWECSLYPGNFMTFGILSCMALTCFAMGRKGSRQRPEYLAGGIPRWVRATEDRFISRSCHQHFQCHFQNCRLLAFCGCVWGRDVCSILQCGESPGESDATPDDPHIPGVQPWPVLTRISYGPLRILTNS